MTVLLDSSVAIAVLASDHEHHQAARAWIAALGEPLATCPITQGAVIRYSLRRGRSASGALSALASLTSLDRHQFWPDAVEFTAVNLDGVIGHRQVTDAYLAQLARSRGGRVATLDGGFAALHSDVADLVPTDPAKEET